MSINSHYANGDDATLNHLRGALAADELPFQSLGLASDVVERYVGGRRHVFALALHEATQLPLWASCGSRGEIQHLFVLDPIDLTCIDARGRTPLSRIHDGLAYSRLCTLRPTDADEIAEAFGRRFAPDATIASMELSVRISLAFSMPWLSRELKGKAPAKASLDEVETGLIYIARNAKGADVSLSLALRRAEREIRVEAVQQSQPNGQALARVHSSLIRLSEQSACMLVAAVRRHDRALIKSYEALGYRQDGPTDTRGMSRLVRMPDSRARERARKLGEGLARLVRNGEVAFSPTPRVLADEPALRRA